MNQFPSTTKRVLWLAFGALGFLLGQPASAQERWSLELTTWQDVMTVSADEYKSENFADADGIMVGSDQDGWVWRSFVQFDLTTVPPDAHIDRAILVFSPNQIIDGLDTQMTIEVYAITKEWDEYEVVWKRQPPVSNSIMATLSVKRTDEGPDKIDLTELVRAYQAGQLENHGIMLKSQDETLNIRRGYHSSNVPQLELHPTLIVTIGRGEYVLDEPIDDPLEETKPVEYRADEIVLWCDDAEGQFCQVAANALGVVPSLRGDVPEPLLGAIQIGADGCTDPETALVLERLVPALNIDTNNLHDNNGSALKKDDMDTLSAGGGCTNCCWNEAEPPFKVHRVGDDVSPHILVRVWEEKAL